LTRTSSLAALIAIMMAGFGPISPAAAQPAASGAIASAPVPGGPGSLNGIWTNAQYKGTGRGTPRERTIRALDGTVPPLLPAPAAVLEKRIAGADAGRIFANSLSRCLPGGMPEMLFGAPYPIQIIESPGQVTMLFEEQNHFRIVHMGGQHPVDPDPSWMGHSIGHWDGDTLVVDTVGLNDRATLDMVGTPQSEKLHIVERYRRSAADSIEIQVAIDDPDTFARPWVAGTAWRSVAPGTQVNEYICENNRNDVDAEGFQSFTAHEDGK
jgi:hypothetical protein